jgi:murein tripeptide amidase MpaA
MKARWGLLGAALLGAWLSHAQDQPLHANARRAEGHLQLRVTARTPEELERVLSLSSNVLSCAGAGVGTFDVETTAAGQSSLAAAGITHEVVRADLGRYIEQVMSANDRLRAEPDAPFFTAYRTLDEIETRLRELAAQYPALARLETLGSSLEGRPIRVLRVSAPGATSARGAFVVNGGQHAREWVTPMTVMYIAERLLLEYGSDVRSTGLLDRLELYLVPVMNPDGYVYTHGVNALWRKNRRRGGACDGVDLNRNWSYGFGGEGSSADPCNETFRGASAFSEPELLGLKALLDSLAAERRLMLHWDVHSNGASILSPWGYTRTPPRDVEPMNRLGAAIQSGMASVRGRSYPYGTIAVQLYLASGVATDYAYGELGAMAWGVELSGDTFMPPQAEILPIAQEGFAGLLALSETVPARQ